MIIKTNEANFLKLIPSDSGVYRFFDTHGSILYVGKAINLNKRISSYFLSSAKISSRIKIMINKISLIEITITDNEHEALILEINLIKSLKPKYNIVFRDDKTYPYIRFTQHQYPRIEYYRGKTNNSDKNFGPYTDTNATKKIIDLIQKIFLIRTCSDNYYNNREKPCMLYQVKRCLAPCVGYVSEYEYSSSINFATKFLSGEVDYLLSELNLTMYRLADELKFEESAKIRDTIFAINSILKTQRVHFVDKGKLNIDVIHYKVELDYMYVYIITIKNGIYINDNHYKIMIYDNDILHSLIVLLENIYLDNRHHKNIYLNYKFTGSQLSYFKKILNLSISMKKSRSVDNLIDMANQNLDKIIAKPKFSNAWDMLENVINKSPINVIECIDISHHHGENCVASVVVAKNHKIINSEYRRYNLSNKINGNDIMAMEYVVGKRYSDLDKLPDVILIDGGVLQYNAIKNILSKFDNYDKIKLIAIYKGEHRNPKFDRLIINPANILRVKDCPLMFSLLQYLRDEAHRFAITGHRIKQENKMIHSSLLDIPNVGNATRRSLLSHFGSVKSIANASIEELKLVKGVGDELANNIYSFFH